MSDKQIVFKNFKILILFFIIYFIKIGNHGKNSVNRSAMKGLGISIALATIVHFTGCYTFAGYSVIIFQKAGTSLDPYVSSIVLAVALILGSLLSTYFADILGRKLLNLISLVGSAIGTFVTALYQYFYLNGYDLSSFQWVPVVSLSFVIFIGT